MIVRVEDEHSAMGVAGNAPRLIELAFAPAVAAKRSDELSVGRELLHAVVPHLAAVDVSVRLAGKCSIVEQDVIWIIELTRFAPLPAPRSYQSGLAPAGIEHLDPMVAGVGHPDQAAVINDDLPGR